MFELNQRLSDQAILAIFENLRDAGAASSVFLAHYAEALATAPRRDFMIMRPVSLILIAKYKLTQPEESRGQERRVG